ncbi:MAG: hypothetical protein ACK5Y8_19175 [Betaproteobacteria bacterium]|jgi:hypothetical protein|nr:hypothetical protein [Burkholderiaceae bacterium]MCZ8111928.1 hypothetical protein [Rubrivivax sp.]MCZ8177016.1 hypothetical protein [Burkholderiaceae bacterium]
MDSETPDAEVRAVATAIWRYLTDHPHAADTVQGIQRWWLLPNFGELPLTTVEAALAKLEDEGAVRRVESDWAPVTWMRSTNAAC